MSVEWLEKIVKAASNLMIESSRPGTSRACEGTQGARSTQRRINIFDLPTDVLLMVYNFLPLDDLMAVDKAATNKQIRPRCV